MRTRWTWIVGSVVAAVLLAHVAAFLAAEPLRRLVEREANARLEGYIMRIGRLDLQPVSFSLDLHDVVIGQGPDLERPVVRVSRLSASLHWSAVGRGRIAVDVELDHPRVEVDRAQLPRVLHGPVPLNKRGRQELLHALRSRQVNDFVIRDGSLTYVEAGQVRPITLNGLEVVARDLGAVPSGARMYPSLVQVRAVVLDEGRLQVDGHADLLGLPQIAFEGHVALDRVALNAVAPVVARHGLVVDGGTLSMNGHVEYAPHTKLVDLEELRIDGLRADYAYRQGVAGRVKEAARATAEAAAQAADDPGVLVKARRLSVRGATVGFVNEQARRRYRVFFADADLVVENFASQFTEGIATARLTGRFMGSGATTISATFRPEAGGADFDLAARIENTDAATMNDLLRAHAKVDVIVSGTFSVFAEAGVKNGRIEGYVKPLFHDLRLYRSEQDAGKSMGQKFKERAADLVAKVLRNRPRQEVATVAPIAGRLDNPKANTWEALRDLVRNAFDEAILPGFGREIVGRHR